MWLFFTIYAFCCYILYSHAPNPSSYQPISHINFDKRILAKTLANLLSKVIESIIHTDQTGFIPYRHSSDTIRRIVDLQYITRNSINPTIAFDCEEWSYLLKHLEISYIFWLKTLYNTPFACVFTNGLISDDVALPLETRTL